MNRIVCLPLIAWVVGFAVLQGQEAKPTTWPAHLLIEPFHIGDSKNRKDMHHPSADDAVFTATFDLPEAVKPGPAALAWVTVRVTGLLPTTDKRLKEPRGRARILINQTEIGDLNKLSHGNGRVGPIERQQFRIPGHLLQQSGNQLEIRPGATPNNLLDFELHEITVAATPQ